MRADLQGSFNFTDLQGLGALRREAREDTPEARRVVAQQFEALFLNQLLKQMRDATAVIDSGLVDRDRMRFHEDMLDQQMALTLSQGRGIGLADAILRQIGGEPAETRPAAPVSSPNAPAATAPMLPADARHGRAGGLQPAAVIREAPAPEAMFRARAAASEPFAPDTPEDFVDALWPYAEGAARRLGVPAEVLVAQAALETGWGRHMIRDAAGQNSFNLFGIKATGGWEGRQARVSTLEFINGVPERRQEPFRVYDGLAQSFEDYVRLIESRPRYAEARAATTVAEYARALQAGGYATDPEYAEKIIAIVERGLPGRPAPEHGVPVQPVLAQPMPGPDGSRDQVRTASADKGRSELAARVRPATGDEA